MEEEFDDRQSFNGEDLQLLDLSTNKFITSPQNSPHRGSPVFKSRKNSFGLENLRASDIGAPGQTTFSSEQQLKEAKRREETYEQMEETRYQRKWQSFVIATAIFKFLIINLLDRPHIRTFLKSNQTNVIAVETDYFETQMTVCVSILLFGNILDNSTNQKRIAVGLDLIMAFYYCVKASFQLYLSMQITSEYPFIENLIANVDLAGAAMSPTLNIMIWMQLFNWVSKRNIAFVYGVLSVLQAGSNILKFKVSYQSRNWELFYTGSGVMCVLALVDYFWYKFYPLEAGIFVDQCGRNKDDFQTFKQLQTYVKNNNNGLTVFNLLYKNQIIRQTKITFIQVFRYTEIQILIFTASTIHTALLLGIGYQQQLFIGHPNVVQNQLAVFYAGYGCSTIGSTILFQYVFQRKFAISIVSIQTLGICISSFLISFNLLIYVDQKNDASSSLTLVYCFVYGLVQGSTVLLTQLIGPLLIAASNRKTYEVTMAGTMIAVCTALPFVFGTAIGLLFLSIGLLTDQTWIHHLIILLFSYIGTLPLLLSAVDDFTELTHKDEDSELERILEKDQKYIEYSSNIQDEFQNRTVSTVSNKSRYSQNVNF